MSTQGEKGIKEFQKKTGEVIEKMLRALIRAQRKVDDQKYRETLQKLDT